MNIEIICAICAGILLMCIGSYLVMRWTKLVINGSKELVISIMSSFSYLLSELVVVILLVIFHHENMAFEVVIGSSLFQQLVYMGIKEMTQVAVWINHYVKQNHSFLIFSSTVLLFLAGDYLLFSKHAINQVSKMDGAIIVTIWVVYVVYNIMTYNSKKSGEITDSNNTIEESESAIVKENNKEKQIYKWTKQGVICKYVCGMMILLSALIGGAYIGLWGYDNLSITSDKIIHLIGFVVIPIIINIAYVAWKQTEECGKNTPLIYKAEINYQVTGLLLACGIIGLCYRINVNNSMIYSIILLIIVEMLQWIVQFKMKKVQRFAGCAMVTLYIAYIGYFLVH